MEKYDDMIVESVKKELCKLNINFDVLDKKKQDLLIQCEDFLQQTHNNHKEAIESLKEKSYSVNALAKKLSITRSALYKKKTNGDSNYREVLLYLNSRSAYFINKDKQLISQLLQNSKVNTEELKKQIELLVLRDVKYMELKKENKELHNKISKLEKDKAILNKEVSRLINIKLN